MRITLRLRAVLALVIFLFTWIRGWTWPRAIFARLKAVHKASVNFVKENWRHLGFLICIHFWVVAYTFPLPQPNQSYFQHLRNATFSLGTPTMVGLSIGGVLEACTLLAAKCFLDSDMRQKVEATPITLSIAFFLYVLGALMQIPPMSREYGDFVWLVAMGMAHGKFGIYTFHLFPKVSMLLQCLSSFWNILIFVFILSNLFADVVFAFYQYISPIMMILLTCFYEYKTQKEMMKSAKRRADKQVQAEERIIRLETDLMAATSFSNPSFSLQNEC